MSTSRRFDLAGAFQWALAFVLVGGGLWSNAAFAGTAEANSTNWWFYRF